MLKNRGLTIILSIYVVGVISSFIIVSPTKIVISDQDISVMGVIKTFFLNYWYVFIMWILGMSLLGFIVNLFIVYFRGFIYGVLIISLMKSDLEYLLAITLIELVIFVPVFMTISYSSIMLSYSCYRQNQIKMDFYNRLMVIATVLILIYSLLLEIVGGLYA